MASGLDPIVELLRLIEEATPEGAGEVGVSLAILVVVLGVRYLARRWRESLEGSAELANRRLLVSGIVAAVTTVGVLALIGVWGLLTPLYDAYLDLGLNELGGEFVLAAVLVGGAYAVTSFIGRLIEELTGSHDRISEHQREVLYRLTQVGLYTVVGLIVVTLFTKNLGGLLVGAGFLGIVVGMAARQTLGAVLAGFVLMFSRPFEIGDWVEIGEREGIVTDITIVNTRIQTFDGEYVMLPNDQVSGSAIVNRTRKGRLRTEIEVGIDYDADPDRAADVALDAVEGLDKILAVPTPQVVLKRFGDSSVVLGVRFWIDNPSARRRWRAQTAAITAIKGAFEAEGIRIPFPQRELSERTDGESVSLAGGGAEAATPDGGEGSE